MRVLIQHAGHAGVQKVLQEPEIRERMDAIATVPDGRSPAEFAKYGRNRLSEGKLPVCAEMCSTKALLGGDGEVIANIYRDRVTHRGKGGEVWGWATAYKVPEAGSNTPSPAPPAPTSTPPSAVTGGTKS